MIENKLLNMLVCPVTKGKLSYDRKQQCFISQQAKLRFPVVDGVPNMLIDAALPLDDVNVDGSNDVSKQSGKPEKSDEAATRPAVKTPIDKTNED